MSSLEKQAFKTSTVRAYRLLIEYKKLRKFLLEEANLDNGYYVVPDDRNAFIWLGTLVCHSGPFKHGIFRFAVFFSQSFPNEAPSVYFISKIFHPLVDGASNKLHFSNYYVKSNTNETSDMRMSSKISFWTPVTIIKYMEYMLSLKFFHQIASFDCINVEAQKMFIENHSVFWSTVQRCVSLSVHEGELFQPSLTGKSENVDTPAISIVGLVETAKRCFQYSNISDSVYKEMLDNILRNYDTDRDDFFIISHK